MMLTKSTIVDDTEDRFSVASDQRQITKKGLVTSTESAAFIISSNGEGSSDCDKCGTNIF